MGLTCWMTLTLAGFLYAERTGATRAERAAGMHAAWAGMALAVLSKGLIGIVLPGGVLVFYSLWQRDLRLWDRLHIGTGLLLFFAITAPWFVWVQARNPEFSEFFFFHEHLANPSRSIPSGCSWSGPFSYSCSSALRDRSCPRTYCRCSRRSRC